jgi:hypothetical protein
MSDYTETLISAAGGDGDQLADIEARRADCQTYNFGMRNADKLAHEDVPYLLVMVREQQAALERAKAIHEPCQMFEYDDVNGVFVLEAEEKVVMSTICRGCTPDEVIEDAEDWSFDESRAVNWPCPTIAALTATEQP